MEELPIDRHGEGVRIRVWVVPGARRPGLAGRHGDRLKLRVAAPASEGRANREAEGLLTAALGVEVVLIRGKTRRDKVFEAKGIATESARRKLGL